MTDGRGEPLLSVRGLEKHYPVTAGVLRTEVGRVRAVDGVSFDLHAGDTFGIVGESGCGKTTAALAMTRLREPTAGEIRYRGRDVRAFDREELKRFRRDVQVVFQDPNASLDPRMSVGDALEEPLVVQGMADASRRRDVVHDLVERVGLTVADAERYPHELSGGQKQRVGLARALAVNPEVIIADEPVSALDVSVQAEILALIRRLKEAHGLTVVVISHDLGVVREVCDRVAVMYLGEFVEVGPTEAVFDEPLHPYTRELVSVTPVPDPGRRGTGAEIRGDVPDPAAPPSGCRFHTRCPEVIPPPDLDVEQAVWRDVLHLRHRLRDGHLDLGAIVETAADAPGAAPEALPDGAVQSAVRREFGLPETLADPDAEATLSRALDRLAAADVEAARAALDEAFVTPCELERPRLAAERPDREVACHLYADDVTDHRRRGRGVAPD